MTKTVTNLDQRWLNLMVGTMVFREYDWNADDPISRECCLETNANYTVDGTCSSGGSDYVQITEPIQMQVNPNKSAGYCCASEITNEDDEDEDNPDIPGVQTGTDTPYKGSIAHEMGHVIAMRRIGSREERHDNFSMNECNGAWAPLGTPALLSQAARGVFTKESMSTSLREGWGDFVSVATWNDRSEVSCQGTVNFNWNDYDLDGDIDDDRSNNDLDRAYDCAFDPIIAGDPALVPTSLGSVQWLEALEDLDDDDVDGKQCDVNGTAIYEDNRSTVYDVTKFFWKLTSDWDLYPGELSDIYVDMCPRGWSQGDLASTDDSLPLERLLISGVHHGLDTYVDYEASLRLMR